MIFNILSMFFPFATYIFTVIRNFYGFPLTPHNIFLFIETKTVTILLDVNTY